ncbi:DUF3139 domain-containing protein [Clostridium sp. AWRP]|uniref:DUF3139 domain-containing protein n=1 Tax=Clostridium sp. AWRP TaxID=2212991 RepID=UPI001586A9EE|nr:DUF3139 domain-containing protein [Clostridium sp. AWRP]
MLDEPNKKWIYKHRKAFIIVTVLIVVYLIQMIVISYRKYLVYNNVRAYLINTKGYKTQDIKKIKVTHTYLGIILGSSSYSISVVFTDEPNALYQYAGYDRIYQLGVAGKPNAGKDFKYFEKPNGSK